MPKGKFKPATEAGEPAWRGKRKIKIPDNLTDGENAALKLLQERANSTWQSPVKGVMAGSRYIVAHSVVKTNGDPVEREICKTLDSANLAHYMMLIRCYTSSTYTPHLHELCEAVGLKPSGRTNVSRFLRVLEMEGILQRHGKQFRLTDKFR